MDFKTEAIQKIIDYKLCKIDKEELINFCGKLFEMKSDEIGEWKNEIYILSKSRMIKRFELKQTWVEIEITQEENNLTYQTLTVVSDNEIFSLGVPL